MNRHDVFISVKEMWSRGWDVYEIAAKLKLDLPLVQSIIDLLT